MTDTFYGTPSDDTLSLLPNFTSVISALSPTAIPIAAGSVTTLDPRSGKSRWQNSWVYRMLSSEDKFSLMSFWYDKDGGIGGFWLPSWVSDFVPSAGLAAGQLHLDIEDTAFKTSFDALSDASTDYTDPSNPPENEWGLMIMDREQNKHFRGIRHMEVDRIDFWAEDKVLDGSDLSTGNWVASGTYPPSIVTNSEIAPDGTLTADTMTAPTGNDGNSNLRQVNFDITTGGHQTTIAHFKKGASNETVLMIVYLLDGGGSLQEHLQLSVDLFVGTASVSSQSRPGGAPAYDSSNFTVEDRGDGYWRVQIRSNDYDSNSTQLRIRLYPRGTDGVLPLASPKPVTVWGVEAFVDGGVPAAIAKGDLLLISLVRFVRFNTGEIQTDWLTDNSKVDISVAFTELFFEGKLA